MVFVGWTESLITKIKMKEESLEIGFVEEQVPTVEHRIIMTEEFIKVYQQALQFSNLELHVDLKFRNVSIYENQHIHQLYTVGNPTLPHLVLLHGYGGTSLTFVRMFEYLKDHFQVHALDTFGIGLSSRGNWHDKMTAEEAGNYYIDAVEEWRKKIGLSEFILAGHSFGGYISALYFQKYPARVKQILFISPAGTAKFADETIKKRAQNSKFFFCIAQIVYNMHIRPSKLMTTSIIGNKFIDRILTNRLKLPENQKTVWKKYLKLVCSQDDCSEKGFYLLFDWPLQPTRSIEIIISQMKPTIKIDFLYGDQDWMQPEGAQRLSQEFKNISVHIIQNAGHQMMFDNPEMVSAAMKKSLQ